MLTPEAVSLLLIDYRGPIYQISYDLPYDYLKFVIQSTYDKHTVSEDLTILQMNYT